MHNQFCKNCGQANFPDASRCSKCGSNLTGASAQAQTPPPSPQSAPPNLKASGSPETSKKSSNKFLIIGGIAAVFILILGFIGVIAGIGGYFYLTSNGTDEPSVQNQTVPENSALPAVDLETNKEVSENEPDSPPSGTMTDAKLEGYMKNDRRTVGSYTLDNVKPFKGEDFSGRIAGITALYTKGGKSVVHSIAMYGSYNEASDGFEKYKRGIGSMQGSQIRSNEADRIIFSHEGSVFLTFCNKAGGCHELISKDGNTILDYYNSYFGAP